MSRQEGKRERFFFFPPPEREPIEGGSRGRKKRASRFSLQSHLSFEKKSRRLLLLSYFSPPKLKTMVSSSRAASLLSGLLPRAGRAAVSALASSSSLASTSSSSSLIAAAAASSSLRFFYSGVPMTEPLPGLVLPTPASSSGAPAPVTQLTTLPNGAKIASEDTAVRIEIFFLSLFFATAISVLFFFLEGGLFRRAFSTRFFHSEQPLAPHACRE